LPRLLIILTVLPLFAFSQYRVNSNTPALHFDVPESLQKAGVKSVRCIFKDSRGLMWFGTSNGLYRFDGQHVLYQRRQIGIETSLPDNTITNIAEDKHGNIWIATLRGIARMNPYNFQCYVYWPRNGSLKGDFDNKVLVDKDGVVWAGNSQGLSKLDTPKNIFVQVWKASDRPDDFYNYVSCLNDHSRDTLAFGTFKGAVLLHKKNHGNRFIMNESPVTALFTDSKKQLWCGSWGRGLQKYDQHTGKFIPVATQAGIVNSIAETPNDNGTLWVSSPEGLIALHANAVSIYKNHSGSLMADENGTVWMAGGKDTGVARFTPGAPVFKQIDIPLEGVINDVQQAQVDSRTYYFVSSWHGNKGLTVLNEQWQVVKQFDHLPEGKKIEGANSISGVAVDKLNRTWVSTLAGLTILNSNLEPVKSFTVSDVDTNRLAHAKTNAVLIAGDTAWVACYKKGIDLYDIDLKKIAHFENGDGSGLQEDLIWRFYRDKKNNTWILGNNKLYLFNSVAKKFIPFSFLPGNESYGPRDITELQNGDLLLACANGLIQLDANSKKYLFIRSPLLQKEDEILSVSTDHEGKAWYLTTDHLVRYDPVKKQFTLFGTGDGLRITDGMQIVRCFKPGELTIGQDAKLLHFNYNTSPAQTAEGPSLVITNLQVNDSTWTFAEPVRSLELRHFQNKFFIEFAGINYDRADQNQFAVMMEGIDKDWIISNHAFASYGNLAPGSYTFRAKAADFAGRWGPEYAMTLNISPPFWRTWWFIILAGVVSSGVFFAVVRYISQRNLREKILVLEKEQAVEKERTRIARDMHDDLGSGLTKIAIMSEVARKQMSEPGNVIRQLENISSSSRELVDNLQDIIWVLNPRNDSLESLCAYIREYALKFFEPSGLHLQFNFPASIPMLKLSEEVRRNLFLVVKETFNNIAKHAGCIKVELTLNVIANEIEICIADDGKGFEIARIPAFHNGIGNMKNRMEQVGGRYDISSVIGRGTSTRLMVRV